MSLTVAAFAERLYFTHFTCKPSVFAAYMSQFLD